MCVCWLVALKIQLTIKVLPYHILLLLLLFSVPFSLRSFTNSSWEAEILPDPNSTKAHSSAKAHGKENRANRAKPCAATWGQRGWGGGRVWLSGRYLSPSWLSLASRLTFPLRSEPENARCTQLWVLPGTGILLTAYTF